MTWRQESWCNWKNTERLIILRNLRNLNTETSSDSSHFVIRFSSPLLLKIISINVVTSWTKYPKSYTVLRSPLNTCTYHSQVLEDTIVTVSKITNISQLYKYILLAPMFVFVWSSCARNYKDLRKTTYLTVWQHDHHTSRNYTWVAVTGKLVTTVTVRQPYLY